MSKTGEDESFQNQAPSSPSQQSKAQSNVNPQPKIQTPQSSIQQAEDLVSKEVEEEIIINKELEESDAEQPEKINQLEKEASKLKIKLEPEAVKQEPPAADPSIKKTKLEEDIKRWKTNLTRISQISPATQINDEDYLINREHYVLNRDEFATGHHSKLYKCKKEGVEQIVKMTPLKNVNIQYKNNLLKNAILIMRYLTENQHPSLVQHFAFYQSPNKIYVFQEPLSNINLHTFIKKNRKPNSASYLQKVKKYGRDVAEGINHLYVIGVSHSNIKTVNVCLTADQSSVKLVGFNNSKLLFNPIKGEEILSPKHSEWNYNYAPETIKGEFKCMPADIWAFGILIVCLLTCKPPFPKKMHRIETRLRAHLHRYFCQPEQTLLNLLLKCFEKNPANRIDIGNILLHPYFN